MDTSCLAGGPLGGSHSDQSAQAVSGTDASGDGGRPQAAYPASEFKNSFKEVLPSVEVEAGTGVGVVIDLMNKK